MKKAKPRVVSYYLKAVVCTQNLAVTVRALKACILESGLEFNAIAFRGMSGAFVVPMLATRLRKGIIVCRKPSEESHGRAFEGLCIGGNYIIVDDFIGGGTTVRGIIDVVNAHCYGHNQKAKRAMQDPVTASYTSEKDKVLMSPFNPVGIFLYRRRSNEAYNSPFKYEPSHTYGTYAEGVTYSIPVFGCREHGPKDLD